MNSSKKSSADAHTLADVCIVGLGYVGLTLATAFAVAGLRVVGVERRPDAVAHIAAGESPFHEYGLDEALASVVQSGRLTAVPPSEPVPAARAYVITVGTPLREGEVHLSDIEDAISNVARAMPENALVILRSTVRVGTTRTIAAPILDRTGKPYLLAMVPERTIEGKALAELSSLPQIVGGINDESAAAAAGLFSSLGVEIVSVGTVEAAELAKLASNTFRDLQFAFANELAYFSDLAGVDVYDVIRASNYGYDRTNIALPGPVAGPCLEKDAYILAESAHRLGGNVPLTFQGRRTNEHVVEHIESIARARMKSPPTEVGILGLAFKGRPATSDTRGSLAGEFARSFRTLWPHAKVLGWDPVVAERDYSSLSVQHAEPKALLGTATVILVQTNHRYFSSPEFVSLIASTVQAGTLIIDLWNQVPSLPERPDVTVVAFGRAGFGGLVDG